MYYHLILHRIITALHCSRYCGTCQQGFILVHVNCADLFMEPALCNPPTKQYTRLFKIWIYIFSECCLCHPIMWLWTIYNVGLLFSCKVLHSLYLIHTIFYQICCQLLPKLFWVLVFLSLLGFYSVEGQYVAIHWPLYYLYCPISQQI